MPPKRILIVDDDQAVRDMVVFSLGRHGLSADEAGDADTARRIASQRRPDLVILECALPGASGLMLTQWLRRNPRTQHVPIVMLSVRTSEDDKVRALEAGADDYVTKPFSARELVARIHAVLRRALRGEVGSLISAERLCLDLDTERVTVGDELLRLSPMDFRLLAFLMANPERAYGRDQLMERVWGTHTKLAARSVDVQVSRLRKLLEPFDCDRYVQTVHGAGYRFSTKRQ